MAPQCCRFCHSAMDPRDGHRECPSCLGVAHLGEDVDNPCTAACDLPRDERIRRANRACSSAPERGRARERSSDRHGHKRPRKHSCDHPLDWLYDSPSSPPVAGVW